MAILVTGAAGFIGFHLCQNLLTAGYNVVGIDNLNAYYPISLKKARLRELVPFPKFKFLKLNIANRRRMHQLFEDHSFDCVVHLAAQAGVRYSIQNPQSYIDSNLVGFANILEGCRNQQTAHLVYASSSSVYGLNTTIPFRVQQSVDHPISLYAATKKSNELMAHSYSHLYNLPVTGLRFFTVYGPWGRPDMALFSFTKAIFEGRPIDVYNFGNMKRDFTYIADIVNVVSKIIPHPPTPDTQWSANSPTPESSSAPYRLYNIGHDHPILLTDFIHTLESEIGLNAQINLLPIQPGDVEQTWADVTEIRQKFDFSPTTPIEFGIRQFVDWYRNYYKYPKGASS